MPKQGRDVPIPRFWFENRALIIGGLFGLIVTSCVRGPGPTDTIRNLYGWYVRELKNNVNPLTERRTELKQFLTERMLTSIDNLHIGSRGFDGDALLDPQQFDRDWHSKIAIEQIETRGRTAMARVTLTSRFFGERIFNVGLAKEDGLWKVDDVKIVEGSE